MCVERVWFVLLNCFALATPKVDYTGLMMSANYQHYEQAYVCVDDVPEAVRVATYYCSEKKREKIHEVLMRHFWRSFQIEHQW